MFGEGDEVFSSQQVKETARLFEDSSVIIETYEIVKLDDAAQLFNVQHLKLLSPLNGSKIACKISQWIESQSIKKNQYPNNKMKK